MFVHERIVADTISVDREEGRLMTGLGVVRGRCGENGCGDGGMEVGWRRFGK